MKTELTSSQMGKMGAKARHSKPAAELKAIAKKAAKTRLKNNPHAFKQMGKLGAIKRHSKPTHELSEIAKRTAATRKKNDPSAFEKMGLKGAMARGRRYE